MNLNHLIQPIRSLWIRLNEICHRPQLIGIKVDDNDNDNDECKSTFKSK